MGSGVVVGSGVGVDIGTGVAIGGTDVRTTVGANVVGGRVGGSGVAVSGTEAVVEVGDCGLVASGASGVATVDLEGSVWDVSVAVGSGAAVAAGTAVGAITPGALVGVTAIPLSTPDAWQAEVTKRSTPTKKVVAGNH